MMKRTLIGLFLLFTLPIHAAAGEPPLANAGCKGLEAKSIDEMLALPDEEIDIGLGALLIGKEYDPDLDVPKYLAQLDGMALELRSRIGDETNPKRIITAINRYIFKEQGFTPTADEEAVEQLFLHFLLDRKKGNCSGLSTLYLAIAERMGLPFFGVCVPRHLFVRYDSGQEKMNVETTEKGARHWDFTYFISYPIGQTEASKSFHMRNLKKAEVLALLLDNLSAGYFRRGNPSGAMRVLKKALAINPNDSMAWSGLGAAYAIRRKFGTAMRAFKKALAISPRDSAAWNGLGAAYVGARKYEDAVRAFKKALVLSPFDSAPWTGLGIAYLKQRKLDDSIRVLERAVSIDPNEAQASYYLAVAHYRNRQYGSAWKYVHKCQQLGHRVNRLFLWTLRMRRREPQKEGDTMAYEDFPVYDGQLHWLGAVLALAGFLIIFIVVPFAVLAAQRNARRCFKELRKLNATIQQLYSRSKRDDVE